LLGLEHEIGHLQVGRVADITIFSLEEGQFEFRDPWGASKAGNKKLQSKICIKSGEVIYLEGEATESEWTLHEE
jgi:dihydroorotase